MIQNGDLGLSKLKIAEELRILVEGKCVAIEKEVVSYKSFLLERRPDQNLSGLVEKASDLRKAQDRVSSLRLDILSLQRTAKEKIKKYNEILKSAQMSAMCQVDKEMAGKRVAKSIREAKARELVGEVYQLVSELESVYERTNLTLDYVKEVDSNLRDAAIQLSNQINVVNNMVRIGEVQGKLLKPEIHNGKTAI